MGLTINKGVKTYYVLGPANIKFPMTDGRKSYEWTIEYPVTWDEVDIAVIIKFQIVNNYTWSHSVPNLFIKVGGRVYSYGYDELNNKTLYVRVTPVNNRVTYAVESHSYPHHNIPVYGALFIVSINMLFTNEKDPNTQFVFVDNKPVEGALSEDEYVANASQGTVDYDPDGNNNPPSPTALHRIDHYVTVKNIEDPKLDISMVINKVIWDIKSQMLFYVNREGVATLLGPKDE